MATQRRFQSLGRKTDLYFMFICTIISGYGMTGLITERCLAVYGYYIEWNRQSKLSESLRYNFMYL